MRSFSNKFTLIWRVGLLAGALVWSLKFAGFGFFGLVDTLIFDTYQRIKPRDWAGSDIVVVDIDETSIKRLGQWPWPRSTVADLTNQLGQLGAAAIVFDVVFSEADRTSPIRAIENLKQAGVRVELPAKTDMLDNDVVLASAFNQNRVVTGMILSREGTSKPPQPKAGAGLSGTPPSELMVMNQKAIRNLPILDEAATGIGDFGFLTDAQGDAVVRRTKLMRGANGSWYPSLAMETLRVVQGAGGFKIKSSDGSGEFDSGKRAIVSMQVGALTIPTDQMGAITIYHSPKSAKDILPAKNILFPQENNVSQSELQTRIANHIVLIGTSAAGLLDLRATPLEPIVPGVMVHAEILDQIIAGVYLDRPDWSHGVEYAIALIAVLLLLTLLPLLNPLGDAVATILLVLAVILGCWYAFAEYRMLFSPLVAVLSLLAAYAAGVAADLLVTERQGRYIRNAFGMYLAPAMVKRLAENPDTLTLGGEEKQLTILFCDIRGFTSLSEGLDPVELTELLNNFLTPMTTALLQRGATIDKYMGDAIMAFWNAPIDQADHQQLACEGLLAMRTELAKLNANSDRRIDIGIGLNTGPCCVGNLGSSQRFNYSAIGDAVNVASRVEGQTKQYGLDNLVALETLEGVSGFVTLEVDLVGVVGRDAPLSVHTILGQESEIDSANFVPLQTSHEAMMQAYRDGKAKEGLQCVEQALPLSKAMAIPNLTKLYDLYRTRFSGFLDTGFPDDWDGVFRSTSK